jgi:hypothetical protein
VVAEGMDLLRRESSPLESDRLCAKDSASYHRESPAGRAGDTADSPAKAYKPSPSLEGVKGLTVVLPVTPRLMIGMSLTPPLLDEACIGSV